MYVSGEKFDIQSLVLINFFSKVNCVFGVIKVFVYLKGVNFIVFIVLILVLFEIKILVSLYLK